jgi:hypothetical protein
MAAADVVAIITLVDKNFIGSEESVTNTLLESDIELRLASTDGLKTVVFNKVFLESMDNSENKVVTEKQKGKFEVEISTTSRSLLPKVKNTLKKASKLKKKVSK